MKPSGKGKKLYTSHEDIIPFGTISESTVPHQGSKQQAAVPHTTRVVPVQWRVDLLCPISFRPYKKSRQFWNFSNFSDKKMKLVFHTFHNKLFLLIFDSLKYTTQICATHFSFRPYNIFGKFLKLWHFSSSIVHCSKFFMLFIINFSFEHFILWVYLCAVVMERQSVKRRNCWR